MNLTICIYLTGISTYYCIYFKILYNFFVVRIFKPSALIETLGAKPAAEKEMANGVSLRRIKVNSELSKNLIKQKNNSKLRPKKSGAIFGVHLTIDGYMGDFKLLNDMSIVFKLLNELPEKIGMHKMMPPYVVCAPPFNPKDSGGISGFVMIAESHISTHTFPHRKFVSIDVYTCKNRLPVQFVVDYFKDAFKLQEIEVHEIRRGQKFPEKDLV